ncbi:MAG: hypothetical protein BZ138_00590 [Methanosphaera sp. rholeuAM270]|nr:MAG: hypothetical protein BZ138_00590 [Methanosphaera sp. rholeuAM270]
MWGGFISRVMMDEGCVYLTQSCIIRNLSKKQIKVLCDVSLMLNDLHNCAVETTHLIKSAEKKHYKKLSVVLWELILWI